MKNSHNKSLLLAGALLAGLIGAHSAFADATITVPTPNVFNGKDDWRCTATDYQNKHWSANGNNYNDARQNALDRCEDRSNRPRSCEIERGDCERK